MLENATVTTEALAEETVQSEAVNGVLMKGTYINHGTDAVVEAGSYILNGGSWYHVNNGATSKAFRAWVTPEDASEAREMEFLMENGDGTATAIRVVDADTTAASADGVYMVGGQKVKADSLQGLAKGVYIMNGKKYVVK